MSTTVPPTPDVLSPTAEMLGGRIEPHLAQPAGGVMPSFSPAPSPEATTAPLPGPILRDRIVARCCNVLAGQISMRMAIMDKVRSEVAEGAGVPEALVRSLQSGEADGVSLSDIFKIAAYLQGQPIISLQFPQPPNPSGVSSQ